MKHQRIGPGNALCAGLLAMAALTPAAALAQDYPVRPVSVVVPCPAGSFTDNVMRPVAAVLGKSLGRNVVIDNRVGALELARREANPMPAGTPMPIVEKLHAAVNEALASAEMKKTFAAMATEIEPVTPQALKARMERDVLQWGELIRAAGIQPE